jgi:hypothetical protein
VNDLKIIIVGGFVVAVVYLAIARDKLKEKIRAS